MIKIIIINMKLICQLVEKQHNNIPNMNITTNMINTSLN